MHPKPSDVSGAERANLGENRREPLRVNDQLEHALLAAWSGEANVGLWAIDDDLNIVMMNAAACGMLGVRAMDMLNEPFL